MEENPNDHIAWEELDRQNENDDSSDVGSASNNRISADNPVKLQAVKFI